MNSEARLLEAGKIPAVRLYELPLIRDPRGSLSFAQYDETLPFLPRRYFIVFDVGEGQTRGGHAHRTVHQLLICVKGSCLVSLDDGNTRDQVWLDRPERALYIPPKIWATQQQFSSDGVLLVLASDVYDPDEYIRDYDEFVRLSHAGTDDV
ncbi:MAG TPA: FdtA/QdtA family cupin domain-containing protein [Blastocatellia bacterium]|nr:FdtA/QdtA family cupin domain-containing protein [Blastocatellia bacterium]